jgi:hypothetical protein
MVLVVNNIYNSTQVKYNINNNYSFFYIVYMYNTHIANET